ncbi:MAG: MiaB/RimO family radical SAM methylthiotransferase, partial [Desulfobacterales bacterium]
DGCEAFCTYCIVPYARGKSCSTPPKEVIGSIKQLGRQGYHEVVLTGVHLGVYGMDLTPQTRLASLLADIHVSRGIDRVRLSSIEPGELTDEIIDRVAESDTFCHHLHIPLQSGDDTLLERMHRPYDRRLFRDVVSRVHGSVPDAAIGADVLVGFPGETEAAFENTWALINELPISYLHVFPFSARKGTPASRYPDPIPVDAIRKRCNRIRLLGDEKKKAFYRQSVGKRVEIVIEGKAPGVEGFVRGVTSNYIPVLIPADNQPNRSMVQARIDRADGSRQVFGTMC